MFCLKAERVSILTFNKVISIYLGIQRNGTQSKYIFKYEAEGKLFLKYMPLKEAVAA